VTGAGPIKGDAIANPIDSRNATDEREWISATVGATGFRTDVQAGPHAFVADEPIALGGSGLGPTPYELLLGALSSCMAMTLRMYADRKQWPLQSVTVQLRTDRAHQQDCERCDTADVGPPRIARRIELAGPLSDEQRKRLLQIADRCPVKQTLERGLRVEPVSA
jgi:putative redox protein